MVKVVQPRTVGHNFNFLKAVSILTNNNLQTDTQKTKDCVTQTTQKTKDCVTQTTQKTKDCVTQTTHKTGGEIRCLRYPYISTGEKIKFQHNLDFI